MPGNEIRTRFHFAQYVAATGKFFHLGLGFKTFNALKKEIDCQKLRACDNCNAYLAVGTFNENFAIYFYYL